MGARRAEWRELPSTARGGKGSQCECPMALCLVTVGAFSMLLLQGNWENGDREVSKGSPDTRSHGHDCRRGCRDHGDHWIAMESPDELPVWSRLPAETYTSGNYYRDSVELPDLKGHLEGTRQGSSIGDP